MISFKNLFIFITVIVLSGCTVLAYKDSYSSEYYWINPSNNNKADYKLENYCWEKAENKYGNRVINLEKDERVAISSKCLYQKGYRFRTKSWVFCYKYPNDCKILDKYRN